MLNALYLADDGSEGCGWQKANFYSLPPHFPLFSACRMRTLIQSIAFLGCFLRRATPVRSLNATALDCGMRLLSFRYARYLQPWREETTFQQIHDALELDKLCHLSFQETFSKIQEDKPSVRPRRHHMEGEVKNIAFTWTQIRHLSMAMALWEDPCLLSNKPCLYHE
jgi:hypothetical protein